MVAVGVAASVGGSSGESPSKGPGVTCADAGAGSNSRHVVSSNRTSQRNTSPFPFCTGRQGNRPIARSRAGAPIVGCRAIHECGHAGAIVR